MRRAPGTGKIIKYKDKRRKPYRAQFPGGYRCDIERGKTTALYFECGYYKTQASAQKSLDAYMRNPKLFEALHELKKQRKLSEDDLLNLNPPPDFVLKNPDDEVKESPLTWKQAFDLWHEYELSLPEEKRLGKASYANRVREAKKLSHFNDTPLKEIWISDYQKIVDESKLGRSANNNFKIMVKTVYDFLLLNRYITKHEHIAKEITLKNVKGEKTFEHKPFEREFYELVMSYSENTTLQFGKKPIVYFDLQEYLSIIQMMCLCGVRIDELMDLKKSSVYLDKRYFDVLDSKTSAGIRSVPISEKASKWFEHWYNKSDSDYLITDINGDKFRYAKFREYWDSIMDYFGAKHTPHDTRYTCIELLTEAGIDKKFIQAIVGHEGKDVTDKVYRKKIRIEKLIEMIDKI